MIGVRQHNDATTTGIPTNFRISFDFIDFDARLL